MRFQMLQDLRNTLQTLSGPHAARDRIGFLAALLFLAAATVMFWRLLAGAIGDRFGGLALASVASVLLALAAFAYLVILFSRVPRPERLPLPASFDQQHFNEYAERFLEDRFGRSWRLLVAGASIFAGIGLVFFGFDLYGFSETRQKLEDDLATLKHRVAAAIRESTTFTTDTLGRMTAQLEKYRVAAVNRNLRRDLQTDGFQLLQSQAELEFLLGGLVDREHRILRELIESHRDREWVTDQRKAIASFVDWLSRDNAGRILGFPPVAGSTRDFAEPHVWELEALLQPVVPQRPDSALLSRANDELHSALGDLGASFYGDDDSASEGAPETVAAYRSFLRGKIAYLGGRLAFLVGRNCAELSEGRPEDDEAICHKLAETERQLRTFFRRRELQAPPLLGRVALSVGESMERLLPEAGYTRERAGDFRHKADRLALDLFDEAAASWERATAEPRVKQPLLASVALWRGHVHYFAGKDKDARSAYSEAISKAHDVGASYPDAENAYAWMRLTRSDEKTLRKEIIEVISDARSSLEESDAGESSWYARRDTYARSLAAAGLYYDAVSALYEGTVALTEVSLQDPRWSSELLETRKRAHCQGLFRTSLLGNPGNPPRWNLSVTETGNIIQRALDHYAVYVRDSKELGQGIDPEIGVKLARIHHIAGVSISNCAKVLDVLTPQNEQALEHLCKAQTLIRRVAKADEDSDLVAQFGVSVVEGSLTIELEKAGRPIDSHSLELACTQYDVPDVRKANGRWSPVLHQLRENSDPRLEHFALALPKTRMLNNEAWKFRTRDGACANDASAQFEAAELAGDAIMKRGFGETRSLGMPPLSGLLDTVARVGLCSNGHRSLGLASLEYLRVKDHDAGNRDATESLQAEIGLDKLAQAYDREEASVASGPPPDPRTR